MNPGTIKLAIRLDKNNEHQTSVDVSNIVIKNVELVDDDILLFIPSIISGALRSKSNNDN